MSSEMMIQKLMEAQVSKNNAIKNFLVVLVQETTTSQLSDSEKLLVVLASLSNLHETI